MTLGPSNSSPTFILQSDFAKRIRKDPKGWTHLDSPRLAHLAAFTIGLSWTIQGRHTSHLRLGFLATAHAKHGHHCISFVSPATGTPNCLSAMFANGKPALDHTTCWTLKHLEHSQKQDLLHFGTNIRIQAPNSEGRRNRNLRWGRFRMWSNMNQ